MGGRRKFSKGLDEVKASNVMENGKRKFSQNIRGSGSVVKSRSGVPGVAPAEHEFGAFVASQKHFWSSSDGKMTAPPKVRKVPLEKSNTL